MACFLVPTAEAIVVTAAAVIIRNQAHRNAAPFVGHEEKHIGQTEKKPFYQKLMWLANLLWGGAFLLAYEHLWHGEVVPWFPFLTAAADPGEASVMLHEMATVGVSMAVLVTAVWCVMLLASNAIEKRKAAPAKSAAAA